MKIFIYLCFALFSISMSAQTTGIVIDGKHKLPLIGANIYLQNDTTVGIGITNQDGIFKINHKTKIGTNDTIVFSYVGYWTFRCTLNELKHLNYQILMYEKPQQLNEVTVEGDNDSNFLHYTILPALPRPLFAFGGFMKEGKIYIIGGDETFVGLRTFGQSKFLKKMSAKGTEAWEFRSKNMVIYDITNETFVVKKMNLSPRTCHTAQLYKNKIFILGGKRYAYNRKLELTDATMEVYDLDKDTLYRDPVNPHLAVDFTSFIYDDYLYVMGGAVKENVFTNKIHALDLKKGVWYEMEDTIPTERCGRMNGILVGHKVYFFGGNRTSPMWTASNYDLQTGKWQQLCNLKDGVSYPGLAFYKNWIYIYENKSLQVYDIKNDTLSIYQFAGLNLENAGLYYWDGNLYIVGGCVRNGICVTPSATVYCIDVRRISAE